MANNEEPRIQQQLQEAHVKILENDDLWTEIDAYFTERGEIPLTEDEKTVKEEFDRVQDQMILFEARYTPLVREMEEIGDGEVPQNIHRRGNQLINQSLELIAKREVIIIKFDVISLVNYESLQKVFEELVDQCNQLQEDVADVFNAFKGQNNGSTFEENTVQWSHRAGIIIPFLTRALINLHGQNPSKRVDRMNEILVRVENLYPPVWWSHYLKAVGRGILDDIKQSHENIEVYQRELGQLVQDIGSVFGYEKSQI